MSHNRLVRAAGLPSAATTGGGGNCARPGGEGCGGDEAAEADRLVVLGADGQWLPRVSHPGDTVDHATVMQL